VVDPKMMGGRSLDEVGQDMVGYVGDLNAILDLRGHLTQARDSLVALFKVACNGYVMGGDAVSIFDLQARHMLSYQGGPDGFHVDDPLRITLAKAR